MRILFLTPTLKVTGGNLAMLHYAGHLAGRHEVAVQSLDACVDCSIPSGIRVITGKNPLNWRVRLYSCYLDALWLAARRLDRHYDLLVPIHAPLLVHAVQLRKKLGRQPKILLFFQDFFEMPFIGKYIRWLLRRRSMTRWIDSVVAVSTGIGREVAQLSGREVSVVPYGIDDEFFVEQPVAKKPQVLFVGQPGRHKGFDVFVRAMRRVVQAFPQVRACVVAANAWNCRHDFIDCVTRPSRDQLRRIYAESTVYVHAALGESFGLPPVEAMACGTAVVLTENIGTAEYAVDRSNCLTVRYGDVDRIVQSTCELLGDAGLRERLQQNGRDTAGRYRWDRAKASLAAIVEPMA